jgi:Domain of unknown function (DUF4440)
MKRCNVIAPAVFLLCAGLVALLGALPAVAQDPAVLAADTAFLQAAGRGDKAALSGLLDANFSWTDMAGKTQSGAQVAQAIPKLLIDDESKADVKRYSYGQVAVVQAASGPMHVLRVWVKRPAGWRALAYQEARLLDAPPTVTPGAGKDCANPCKSVPFQPQTENERAVILAYIALENSVVARDVEKWASLIADEFAALSSNSNKLLDKATRKSELARSTLAGLSPTPLSSARMFDFGDAVVMESEHQPDRGKPLHVTRVWVKRGGGWVETLSYQTSIQSATSR